MIDQKQSIIYPIIAKSIIKNVVGDLGINTDYLLSKAKQLCYCTNSSYKENIINSIYSRCEHDIVIKDIQHLISVLQSLKSNSAYVCNIGEFWRLYTSLYRFTHSKSFFLTCMPTIVTTLSTLITLVLSNKLLYSADMVESMEGYLFHSQKIPSQELSDLLEMKYGLINLVQYKIFPMLIGDQTKVFNTNTFSAGSINDDNSLEINKLMELPIKTDMTENVYKFLSSNGINKSNNVVEYIAGLKIEEIIEEGIKHGSEVLDSIPNEDKEKAVKMLKDIQKYSKGHVLDGRVTSPITKNMTITDRIPLSANDIEKFTILEYLYIMRVMTNNLKRKNTEKKSPGVILNINSPLKIITVPQQNKN
ncbi:virion assembly protein [Brazilian porcupinepox virus 1]|nr:virion assembly protein [Brazilian porcupinepox virus 1]